MTVHCLEPVAVGLPVYQACPKHVLLDLRQVTLQASQSLNSLIVQEVHAKCEVVTVPLLSDSDCLT